MIKSIYSFAIDSTRDLYEELYNVNQPLANKIDNFAGKVNDVSNVIGDVVRDVTQGIFIFNMTLVMYPVLKTLIFVSKRQKKTNVVEFQGIDIDDLNEYGPTFG